MRGESGPGHFLPFQTWLVILVASVCWVPNFKGPDLQREGAQRCLKIRPPEGVPKSLLSSESLGPSPIYVPNPTEIAQVWFLVMGGIFLCVGGTTKGAQWFSTEFQRPCVCTMEQDIAIKCTV